MMEPADFGNFYDSSQLRRLNLSRLRRVLFQGEMSPGIEIQVRNQKPIVSNPKKFDIDGIPGMVGQSGSTRIWRNTAKGFDDAGARITSRRGRWSFRHGCSMKNAAGVWRSEVRRESIVKHCSG